VGFFSLGIFERGLLVKGLCPHAAVTERTSLSLIQVVDFRGKKHRIALKDSLVINSLLE